MGVDVPGHRYQGQPLPGIKRLIEIAGLRNLENVKLTSYLVQMLSQMRRSKTAIQGVCLSDRQQTLGST